MATLSPVLSPVPGAQEKQDKEVVNDQVIGQLISPSSLPFWPELPELLTSS